MKYIVILYCISNLACTADSSKKSGSVSNSAELRMQITEFEKSCNLLAVNDTANKLESLNNQLRETLIQYKESVLQLPGNEQGQVAVKFSANRKVAIVSWNTYLGGTMQDYIAIAFYQSGDSTGYFNIQYPGDELSENSLVWYDTIACLNSGNHTYYLAHGFGRGSTALWWETTVAYELVLGKLMRTAIFPVIDESNDKAAPDTLSDIIFIELDTHYSDTTVWNVRPVISFLNKSTLLKVPHISDEGGNTKYYHILEFDGEKYKMKSQLSDH